MKRERDIPESICSPWDVVEGSVYTRCGVTDWRRLYTTYVHDHLAALNFKAQWKKRCRVSLEMWPPSSGITSRGWVDSSSGAWVAPPFWWCIDCPHADCKPPLQKEVVRTERVHISLSSPLRCAAVEPLRVMEPLPLDIATVRVCESTFDSLYQSWRAYHTEPLVDGIVLFKHYWSMDDNGAYLRWWQEWSGKQLKGV